MFILVSCTYTCWLSTGRNSIGPPAGGLNYEAGGMGRAELGKVIKKGQSRGKWTPAIPPSDPSFNLLTTQSTTKILMPHTLNNNRILWRCIYIYLSGEDGGVLIPLHLYLFLQDPGPHLSCFVFCYSISYFTPLNW